MTSVAMHDMIDSVERRARKRDHQVATAERTLNSVDLKGRSAEDLLREVLEQHVSLKVVFENGRSVDILPEAELRPLIILGGRVPDGWKDAVYGQ